MRDKGVFAGRWRVRYSAWFALIWLAGLPLGCGDSGGSSGGESTTGETDTAGADGDADDPEPEPDTSVEPDTSTGCDGLDLLCDDGLSCTEDLCVEDGCTNTIVEGFCLVGGACFSEGELDPDSECLLCDPAASAEAFSAVPDGSFCDDGDACTLNDACSAGVCSGQAKGCNDNNPCSDPTCDPETGECGVEPNSEPCDDGDPCTTNDTCAELSCQSGEPTCDDGDACTDDICDGGVCSATAIECDDGNDCTLDGCDAATGCAYEPLSEMPCEGGDLCLENDECVAGECIEGTKAVECVDDGNPCTVNTCLPAAGCVGLHLEDPCDDGFACTVNDTCKASLCVGSSVDCSCSKTDFAPDVQKATVLVVGTNGQTGAGLDVDGDPDSCAPVADCGDGIDNALADLSGFLNPALQAAVDAGTWVTVAEMVNPNFEGEPFELRLYGADLDDAASPGCNVQTEFCSYEVLGESFGPDCEPSIALSNATIVDNVLTAGGKGEVFVVGLPLGSAGAPPVQLFMMDARIEATIIPTEDGTGIASVLGVVAGAVPKAVIFEIVSNLDEEYLGGLTLRELTNLIELVLDEDIDLDGDGEPDAASLGLRIETIGGEITGLKL